MSSQLPHEIVDSRLDILEAENERFDERVAESIKRLSESGQITSSSGNALNVKNIPDKQAAKADFFGGGEAIGGSGGGFVHIVDGGSRLAPDHAAVYSGLTGKASEDKLAELFKGVESTRLIDGEELPHTLPPHIARMVEERDALQDRVEKLDRYQINAMADGASYGYQMRRTQLGHMAKYLAALIERITYESQVHFGGES